VGATRADLGIGALRTDIGRLFCRVAHYQLATEWSLQKQNRGPHASDPRSYSMFTARAARSAIVAKDMDDCTIIRVLAQRESTGTSVGEKSGAGVEGEKQVIDETGAPLILAHFLAKFWVQ
jgi:hypothetical protein